MRFVVHANDSEHQRKYAALVEQGLRTLGHDVARGWFDSPSPCDVAVVWGWRQNRIKKWCAVNDVPVLLMERGHVQPRHEYVSLGWNGLAGRGVYPREVDQGQRFERLFAHYLRPWKTGELAHALLVEQVAGDASLEYGDAQAWLETQERLAPSFGLEVRVRPHPLMDPKVRPLAEDLAWADVAIMFNSTTGVECVLAGVPVVCADRGSMVWELSTPALPPVYPDRETWCRNIAWAQWSEEEIVSGEALAVVLNCLPSAGPIV